METKYNDWLIIDENPMTRKGKKYFKCRCKCGLEKYVQIDALKKNQSKRCSSCAGKQITLSEGFTKSWNGQKCGELNRTLFAHIKSKADARNMEFRLTQQFLWDLLVEQDFKCKLSGLPIYISTKIKNGNPDFSFITASVDRIDSKKGYTKDNVQWVHKDVNRMKQAFPEERLLELCQLITNRGGSCGV